MEKWTDVKLFYLVEKKKKDYEKCNLYKFTLLISCSYYIKKKINRIKKTPTPYTSGRR